MSWEPAQTVTNLEQFVGVLRDVMPSTAKLDHLYWFRGQSDSSWNLKPAFMRSLGDAVLPTDGVIGLERQALKAFQSKAHFFVSPPMLAKVRTTPCWSALMQHHGAPTRLLDWTVSPYVAAYFASHHEGSSSDGAVWCFCFKKLRQSVVERMGNEEPPDFDSQAAPAWYEDKLLKFRDEPLVMPMEFVYPSSERMVAEQGRFTMCTMARHQQDCVIDQIGSKNVRKLIIPHKMKADFLLRLRDMNITGAALFPGVDGLGQSVKELISLGSLYRQATAVEPQCSPEAQSVMSLAADNGD